MNPDNIASSRLLSSLTRPSRAAPGTVWKPILFSLLLCGALAGLFVIIFRDVFRPSVPAVLGTVILRETPTSATATTSSSEHVRLSPASLPETLLFQAAGWVEAAPWPIRVTTLIDGIVDQVHVLEGNMVAQGDVLATLNDQEIRLGLQTARLEVQRLELMLASHLTGIAAMETGLAEAEMRIRQAEAAERNALDALARLEALPHGGTSEREIIRARNEWQAATSMREAMRLAHIRLAQGIAESHVMHAARLSEIESAKTQIATMELRLERTRITAPVDGVIMRRLVEPGSKRMANMDDIDSATIVLMYQPDQLQVRVDVPIADAARLQPGMATRITSALLPGITLHGEVSRITGEADVQRNTLQAKVRLRETDPRLRPDVLCRVEFFAGTQASALPSSPPVAGIDSGTFSLWIPTAALHNIKADHAEVWTVDPDFKAHKRQVSLSTENYGDMRRVLAGVFANERVVVSHAAPLHEGVRINATPPGEKP